jgi:3-polyprenyl-4-hydroxybenzoate decarboxylase
MLVPGLGAYTNAQLWQCRKVENLDPVDVLDHATSEIASGSKLGIDATKKIPGEGFKRPWPQLIKMDAAVKAKVEKLFGGVA